MSKPEERRDFWRVPFHSLARLTCASGIMREGHLHDISLKGALLEMVTDWQGNPVCDGGQVLAAASRDLHAEALERRDHPVPVDLGAALVPYRSLG